DSAYGSALVVVFMVSVDEPEPTIVAGLNPPLLMPVPKPLSLLTASDTVPPNPVNGLIVTVKLADCPGTMVRDDGVTSIEKSGVVGATVIMRVGGAGSELPAASMTVSDAM